MSENNVGLYLVKLSFQPSPGTTGAGRLELNLTVQASNGALHGQASGTFLEGTAQPKKFTAHGSGTAHSTGLAPSTKVGIIQGSGVVSVASGIGSYLVTDFSASFSVDKDWNGTGDFTIDKHTYKAVVKKVEALQTLSEPANVN